MFFEQTLLLFPLICALYFSYIVLKITDVSVDGSMVLGAAITSKLLLSGYNPITALLLAMAGGFFAGVCVALIQYKDSINDIIAGLLMSFILYSVNLNIMGKPHIMTMHTTNLMKVVSALNFKNAKFVLVLVSWAVTIILCLAVMYSKLGLKLRGFGENRTLMARLGFKPELYRMIGLGMCGLMAAFCGSIMSQVYGYSDINMGFGMAITSIGALVIGIHLVGRINIFKAKLSQHSTPVELIGCFVGIFCYFSITNSLILLEVDAINFKLILGVVVILFLKLARKSGTAN